MFKNLALQARLVKTNDKQDSTEPTPNPYMDPERMTEIAKDMIRTTAKAAVVVLAASFVMTAAEKLLDKALETK